MTTGLLIVIVVALLFASYSTGVTHGVRYTDYVWRAWLGARVKVAEQRSRVEDLNPRKNND